MIFVILVVSCHHWRAPQTQQDGREKWSDLAWEPADAPMHNVDEMVSAARAARAMQDIDLMQISPSHPVVLGPETTGWDGERCFSTAMPVAEHDGCYLVPFRVAQHDAIWLFYPDLHVAARPVVHGTDHGVTLVCTPTSVVRAVATVEPHEHRTLSVAVPGGIGDSRRCPNAPTLRLVSGEPGAWINVRDMSVPFERFDVLYGEAPEIGPSTLTERLWDVETASMDGVQFYRFRDRISHVGAIIPRSFMDGQTDDAVFYYDLDGSGYFDLELAVTRTAFIVGWFDGDEDGTVDSCWLWDASSPSAHPSTIGHRVTCPVAP